MNATISILDPTAPARSAARQTRRTLPDLTGLVVGFVDNSKPNFSQLADDIGELMQSRHGVKSIVKHSKRLASIPADDAALQDLAARCDLVITGSGD